MRRSWRMQFCRRSTTSRKPTATSRRGDSTGALGQRVPEIVGILLETAKTDGRHIQFLNRRKRVPHSATSVGPREVGERGMRKCVPLCGDAKRVEPGITT